MEIDVGMYQRKGTRKLETSSSWRIGAHPGGDSKAGDGRGGVRDHDESSEGLGGGEGHRAAPLTL